MLGTDKHLCLQTTWAAGPGRRPVLSIVAPGGAQKWCQGLPGQPPVCPRPAGWSPQVGGTGGRKLQAVGGGVGRPGRIRGDGDTGKGPLSKQSQVHGDGGVGPVLGMPFPPLMRTKLQPPVTGPAVWCDSPLQVQREETAASF